MKLAQYSLSVLAAICVTLLAYPLSLALYFFADGNGYLPRWLSWFQTTDNPIWGDIQYGNNQGIGKSKYVRSVMWLCRNPAQGLDSWLGAWYELNERPVVRGKANISDVGGVAGWCLITLSGYFHLLAIIPPLFVGALSISFGLLTVYSHSYIFAALALWFSYGAITGKCIHAEFGWRIQQIAVDYEAGMKNPMTRQLVFTFRLFRFGS